MKKLIWILLPFLLVSCQDNQLADKEIKTAALYFKKNQIEESVIHLKNALQIDNDNLAAKRMLGKAQLILGNPALAEKEFREIATLSGNKNTVLVPLARALLQQNKFNDVINEIVIDPNDIDMPIKSQAGVHAFRALAYISKNDFDKARESWQESVNLQENNVLARIAHTSMLIHENKIKESLEYLHKLIAFKPNFVPAWLLLADLEKQQLNLSNADKAYTFAIQNTHQTSLEHYYALTQRAQVRAFQDQFSLAKKDIQLASEVDKKTYNDFIAAVIDFRAKNYHDANITLESLLEKEPNNLMARLFLGAAQLLQDTPKDALKNLTLIQTQYTHQPMVLKYIVATQLQLGDTNAAIETLHHYLPTKSAIAQNVEHVVSVMPYYTLWPGNLIKTPLGQLPSGIDNTLNNALNEYIAHANPLNQLLMQYAGLIERNQSKAAFELITSTDVKLPETTRQNLVAMALIQMGDSVHANAILNKMSNDAKTDAVSVGLLAHIAMLENNCSLARGHIGHLLKQQDNPGYYLKLAFIDLGQYKPEAAKKNLHKVLKSQPECLTARVALIKLYLDTDKYKDALDLIKSTPDTQRLHPLLITLQGTTYAQLRQWGHACKALAKLEQDYTDFTAAESAQLLQAYVIGHQNGAEEALARLERLQTQYPNARNTQNLARAYIQTQRTQKGEQIMQDWLQNHPEDAAAFSRAVG